MHHVAVVISNSYGAGAMQNTPTLSVCGTIHSVDVLMQDKACEHVDYEVQSSSGSEQGEEEEEGSEGVCGKELGESGEGGSEEEEEEEMKRQKKLAIIEKEKV